MRSKWMTLLFAVLCLTSIVSLASASSTSYVADNMQAISQAPGSGNCAAFSDGYVWLGHESGLMVFDTDPITSTHIVKNHILQAPVKGLAISGNTLLIATDGDGLHLWDITNNEAPVVKGRFVISGSEAGRRYIGVKVLGNYAYLLNSNNHVVIVNISIPTNPIYVDTVSSANMTRFDIDTARAILAGTNNKTLQIYNLASPTVPTFTYQTTLSNNLYDVIFKGNYLYVGGDTQGLMAWNLTNLNTPSIATSYKTPANARLICLAMGTSLFVTGNYSTPSVQRFNIQGSSIAKLGPGIEIPEGPQSGLYANQSGFLFLAQQGKGNTVIVPNNVYKITGSIWAPFSVVTILRMAGTPSAVAVSGDYGFSNDVDYGVDPVNFTVLSVPQPGTQYKNTHPGLDLANYGAYLYQTNTAKQLQVYSISNPMSPSSGTSLTLTSPGTRIKVKDSWLYVALKEGLKTYNLSSPSNPSATGNYTDSRNTTARALAVTDSFAYLANENNDLVIVDITQKNNPYERWRYSFGSNMIRAAAGLGEWVYLKQDPNKLVIGRFDPSVGFSILTSVTVNGWTSGPADFNFYNNILITAADMDGLRAFSLGQDSASPVQIAAYQQEKGFDRVVVANNRFYASRGNSGITVIEPLGPDADFTAQTYLNQSGQAELRFLPLQKGFGVPTTYVWDTGSGYNVTESTPTLNKTFSYYESIGLIAKTTLGDATVRKQVYWSRNPFHAPNLKMFLGTGYSNAFNLNLYLTENHPGSNWTVLQNFNNLASVDPETGIVSQQAYSQPTSGLNLFSTVVSTDTKIEATLYSSYFKYASTLMEQLPTYGFNSGVPFLVDLRQYVKDSSGLVNPGSFTSEESLLRPGGAGYDNYTCRWVSPGVVEVTATDKYSHEIRLVASKDSTAPFEDQDQESFYISPNLLPGGQCLSYTQITATWATEGMAGLTLPTVGYEPDYSDSTGDVRTNSMSFVFSGEQQGAKLTSRFDQMIPGAANQWFTLQAEVCAIRPHNTWEFQLYHYNETSEGDYRMDISTNILFGVSTIWSTVEIPLYANSSGRIYPQIIVKNNGQSGTLLVRNIQLIKYLPNTMWDRYNPRYGYGYGVFTTFGSGIPGWATDLPDASVVGLPAITLDTNNKQATLSFTGVSSGVTSKGIKATANNAAPGTVWTPAGISGREVGVVLDFDLYGSFNTFGSLMLLAVYGVQNPGQFDFVTPPGQLMALAQFGKLIEGPQYLLAPGRNPYYQTQWIVKSDVPGDVVLKKADFIREQDPLHFGDAFYMTLD